MPRTVNNTGSHSLRALSATDALQHRGRETPKILESASNALKELKRDTLLETKNGPEIKKMPAVGPQVLMRELGK